MRSSGQSWVDAVVTRIVAMEQPAIVASALFREKRVLEGTKSARDKLPVANKAE